MFALKNGRYRLGMQRLCFRAYFEGFNDTKTWFLILSSQEMQNYDLFIDKNIDGVRNQVQELHWRDKANSNTIGTQNF